MKAIQLREFGGADAFEHVDLDDPTPGEGEVLVEVTRAGVNFADTHSTRNDYLAPQELPLVPGAEVAGRTADGRRVAALVGNGGYAERVVVPESLTIPIPDEVDDEQAAGALLQGLTAMTLVKRSARIEPGETILIEAAAGGTGTLAVQIAKTAGAKVIGLASSADKRALVEDLGADATVDSQSEDLGAAILEANDGQKGDAVLHMSGGDAFEAELRALAPLGRMVVFGNASRESRPVDSSVLLHGSKAVIGMWLVHVLARRDLAVPLVAELLEALATGALQVTIGGVYPLSEAARAHQALESRTSAGKLLLDPTS
ncbi:MAG: NADPH:quinone reductase [Solirubrobacterales bacterium 70-9]|nr:MAG: NADPH:quinone reductase [Solirubrobacterales bacterium 70-9]